MRRVVLFVIYYEHFFLFKWPICHLIYKNQMNRKGSNSNKPYGRFILYLLVEKCLWYYSLAHFLLCPCKKYANSRCHDCLRVRHFSRDKLFEIANNLNKIGISLSFIALFQGVVEGFLWKQISCCPLVYY